LAPINFLYGGESIWSVDLDDCNKVCKQFRLSRADDVEILDETYPHGKQKEDSDIFRFTGERNIHIKLQLNTKAKNYLIEEYPECRKLNESELYQSGDYWILDTKISNVMGLRRFYMGLADMITILKTEDSSMILQNISDFTRENILTEIL